MAHPLPPATSRGSVRRPPQARFGLLAGFLALLSAFPAASRPTSAGGSAVDAAIVLAADVSGSIDAVDALVQRASHARALRSDAVQAAIFGGSIGCVAFAYVEWAGVGSRRLVMPWTTVCDPQAAEDAARAIETAPVASADAGGRRTSVSYALGVGALLLDAFEGTARRKIIDISADGTNNDGLPVREMRERVLARGYVVNAILLAREEAGLCPDLPGYYSDNVIGGGGSFVIAPGRRDGFQTALRRKLVLEIGDAGER